MIKNYFKIAWRNLVKNKTHSFINITGLSVGMAVALLIGLWIHSEVSFNKSYTNYNRIAQVMQNQTFNGETNSQFAVPFPMGEELQKNYGSDFKHISMASWTWNHTLANGESKISKSGAFFEPPVTDMLSLNMIKGSKDALKNSQSVILSASTAKALFGDGDPMTRFIKIDKRFDVAVSGVYEDLPENSSFGNLTFIAPWKLYIDSSNWSEKLSNPWRANAFQTYIQLADNANMDNVSARIKDVKLKKVTAQDAAFKPVVFLQPMSKWRLYEEFKNGVNVGGRISTVWLFGIIGFFVLLLACINFMNLSTARSEKRAKEVGIRKAIGSVRGQLIKQFFSESLLMAMMAFVLSLLLVQLTLPFFNGLADKKIVVLWSNPLFWLLGVAFSLVTGVIAGSYPALYLSSFQPVKVLKGTFRMGRFASMPRKVLVVMQFSVSVILIIGTIVVFRQINFAKDRPVGYNKNGLITAFMSTDDIHNHFDAVKLELKNSGAVTDIAESSGSITGVNEVDNGFSWKGKQPEVQGNFGVVFISPEFGKTIDWKFKDGRDFSKDFGTDSTGIILNETAAKFMGLQHPVGETINWDGKDFHVIGVVKDLVMQSPYQPVFRTVFVMDNNSKGVMTMRINPAVSSHQALASVAGIFKKYNPDQPFDYKFNDDLYALKFGDEERVGKLASFFAVLAIFISCLGLFGMATFMAEQRIKEIGVRKVLGASVFNLWGMLSKDFLLLVLIALVIAAPVAYYFMHGWLQQYDYRSQISWWVFAAAAIGAIAITLLTVSFQAIKAALANPVKSLRTE